VSSLRGHWPIFLFGEIFDASAATLTGRVVGVHDSGTITVLDTSRQQRKIRLTGIDAPELKQEFGSRSKQNLSGVVYNKQVKVEWEKRDRFGRIVGKVTFDGRDANLEQVRAGMARWPAIRVRSTAGRSPTIRGCEE
jgi:endonuclease YncB( thermonuclease family)